LLALSYHSYPSSLCQLDLNMAGVQCLRVENVRRFVYKKDQDVDLLKRKTFVRSNRLTLLPNGIIYLQRIILFEW
jgi:hypothetical protein